MWMLLPQFSGQQLLCKGINETGGARERQPGRDRRRGGGRWAKVGGRALGLRSMFFFFSCEMVCMFTTPAVWLWRVCFGGVGYVMGKSMTLSDFRGGETRQPPPRSPLPHHVRRSTKRPHRSKSACFDLLCVSCNQVALSHCVSG